MPVSDDRTPLKLVFNFKAPCLIVSLTFPVIRDHHCKRLSIAIRWSETRVWIYDCIFVEEDILDDNETGVLSAEHGPKYV